MMHDLINDAIVTIKNNEKIGKQECVIKPISNLLIEILKIFQREGYLGEFEVIRDARGGMIRAKLINQINECGVIKPRFVVKHKEFDKWEKRFLPGRDFGILIVSTPQGVMTHKEAKEKSIGGRLLAYVY
jgi:small subunit ribosomal protein S8